jgi:hypothetical protein
MKKLLRVLTFAAVCLSPASGALPESGTITVESSLTGDILTFNGSSLFPPDYAGSFNANVEMNHNPSTGQITASADIEFNLDDFFTQEDLDVVTISNINANVLFSAKVARTGAITRLVGAKMTQKASAKASWEDNIATISVSGSISFRRYEIDSSLLPAQLNLLTNRSNFKVGVRGRGVNESMNFPVPEISITTDYFEDNFIGVEVAVGNIRTTAKGVVSGSADSLFDIQELPAAAYKLSGKRNPSTGISQITLTGQKTGSKGTSALLNVNDSLEVQTGPKMKNTLKAYGYSITF